MEEQAFIYKSNGEIIPIIPENKEFFSDEEINKVVRQTHDKVQLDDGRILIRTFPSLESFNLPYNDNATDVLHALADSCSEGVCAGDVIVSPKKFLI